MKDNGTKIHIDPKLKADIKVDASKLEKLLGKRMTYSDLIKANREAVKRLKRESPELYRSIVNGIFR